MKMGMSVENAREKTASKAVCVSVFSNCLAIIKVDFYCHTKMPGCQISPNRTEATSARNPVSTVTRPSLAIRRQPEPSTPSRDMFAASKAAGFELGYTPFGLPRPAKKNNTEKKEPDQ
ncbi:hypothetical protein AC579_8484 [Pseudocercospora musae]|uniref:Uncharacterized protein n=1 Tax=Pseudocercospora musae TaxID=113226 RepID=A0A139I3U5_9PEZI|nr:hypothetical protein AC579_8484 [Pseudocercospora musae]